MQGRERLRRGRVLLWKVASVKVGTGKPCVDDGVSGPCWNDRFVRGEGGDKGLWAGGKGLPWFWSQLSPNW